MTPRAPAAMRHLAHTHAPRPPRAANTDRAARAPPPRCAPSRAAGRRRLGAARAPGERRAAPLDHAEELAVRVDVEPESRCCESLGKLGCADNRRAVRHGCRRRGEISSIGGAESLVAGELLDA